MLAIFCEYFACDEFKQSLYILLLLSTLDQKISQVYFFKALYNDWYSVEKCYAVRDCSAAWFHTIVVFVVVVAVVVVVVAVVVVVDHPLATGFKESCSTAI